MPVTAVPESLLQRIAAMQRQIDELTRAVGRPSDQMRDDNDNVMHMVSGTANPVFGARGQDVSFSLYNGNVVVTDEMGRDTRPLTASTFNGPVTGDTTGVHHGDVGTSTESHNHYGDLHGNSYGFHFGPVGDGTTQNQINCLRIFHTGAYGDVGDPAAFFQLYGTVHAPSERGLKVAEEPFEAGAIIDAVPANRWRWDPLVPHADGATHAGPMVDDVDEVAPWLVRRSGAPDAARLLTDRDLIGVLWAALREERARTAELGERLTQLEDASS